MLPTGWKLISVYAQPQQGYCNLYGITNVTHYAYVETHGHHSLKLNLCTEYAEKLKRS